MCTLDTNTYLLIVRIYTWYNFFADGSELFGTTPLKKLTATYIQRVAEHVQLSADHVTRPSNFLHKCRREQYSSFPFFCVQGTEVNYALRKNIQAGVHPTVPQQPTNNQASASLCWLYICFLYVYMHVNYTPPPVPSRLSSPGMDEASPGHETATPVSGHSHPAC